jgi:hypothetical protein
MGVSRIYVDRAGDTGFSEMGQGDAEGAMDYGYQLLRHVLQQVFGNLREAAQLTLLLFLAPFVGFVLLGFGAMATGGMPNPEAAGVRCARAVWSCWSWRSSPIAGPPLAGTATF